MQRLVLLTILLTVVYSWEEFRYVLHVLWRKIRKQKTFRPKNFETDSIVSDLVVVCVLPLNLAFILLAPGELMPKLLILAVELLIISLILKGVAEYHWRQRFTSHYTGGDKIVAIVYSLIGLVAPMGNFVYHATHTGAKIGKHMFTLIAPLLIGVGIVWAVHNLGEDQFQKQLDQLIMIAVLGLFLNATINILEHMFRVKVVGMSGLMRVLLGIIIIASLQITV